MTNAHPAWCTRTEPADGEHVSVTLHAAEHDDVIDIRLRLTQPGDETDLILVELEFIDYGELTAYPLPLDQARALRDALDRLLP